MFGTMFKYHILLTTWTAFALAIECATSNDTCRQINSGWVCGLVRNAEDGVQYLSFRGVPYAKQPVGELRFQELQPADPWKDKKQTIEEGPICPQYDELYSRLVNPRRGMSEACIYANVHVPIVKSNGSLPILVFVYGGGFQAGSGNSDLHGPEYLVSNGVIVITFNYRLNILGFFTMNNKQFPANNGLRDIYTLLKWVQKNAKAFGGDPNNVTLMGHSAGAALAHLLSLSKASKGLMHRLILMSGTGSEAFYSSSESLAKVLRDSFLSTLGINSTDPDYIRKKLISMPIADIISANRLVQTKSGLVSFVPTVEKKLDNITTILDANPTTLIKQGRGNNLPLIIGCTSQESQCFKKRVVYLDFLSQVINNPALALRAGLTQTLNSTLATNLGQLLLQRYFNGTPTTDKLLESVTDALFIYPAFKLAQTRAKQKGAPSYLYQFSFDSAYNVVKDALMLNYTGGGAHLEDLTCVFRTNSMLSSDVSTFPPTSRDHLMKYWMTQFVVNFMKCDKPRCDKPKAWPALDATLLNYQSLYDPLFIDTNMQPTKKQMDMIAFFDSIEAKAGTSLG